MALRPVSNSADVRAPGFGIACVLALGLGACSEENGSGTPTDGSSSPSVTVPDGTGAPTDSASSPSQSPSGPTGTPMQTSGPEPGGSSTAPGGTATAGPSAEPNGSGGSGPSGPSPGGAGGMGPGNGGEGAGATAGGDGGATGPGTGGGAGGTGPTGEGDAGPNGEGGAAGADPNPISTECTRELLDGLTDDYFVALSAGDPSTLPLAANVKFTENAEETEIGTTDFWQNAGDVKHSQRALDTTACSVAAQAVVPEGNTDLPIALRIKIEAGEMTEIETIVVRQGDYTASFAVDSNPGRIIELAGEIGWHDEVPEGERATREELTGWVDKYFRAFPSGVCNVTAACRRLENGGGPDGGTFSCGDGAMCSQSIPAQPVLTPRVIIVDEVRGIAAGLTNFAFAGSSGHLDMHMVKMSGGEVHAVHAILRDTDGQSGWD